MGIGTLHRRNGKGLHPLEGGRVPDVLMQTGLVTGRQTHKVNAEGIPLAPRDVSVLDPERPFSVRQSDPQLEDSADGRPMVRENGTAGR